jgi:hypothetical protein
MSWLKGGQAAAAGGGARAGHCLPGRQSFVHSLWSRGRAAGQSNPAAAAAATGVAPRPRAGPRAAARAEGRACVARRPARAAGAPAIGWLLQARRSNRRQGKETTGVCVGIATQSQAPQQGAPGERGRREERCGRGAAEARPPPGPAPGRLGRRRRQGAGAAHTCRVRGWGRRCGCDASLHRCTAPPGQAGAGILPW